MKKQNFDFKALKGTLSRDEMKNVKGGDVITCTPCNGADASTCYTKYCQSQNCWLYQDGEQTYLCQCSGGCGN